MARQEFVIQETHCGIRYRDGKLEVLGPGRYRVAPKWQVRWLGRPVEILHPGEANTKAATVRIEAEAEAKAATVAIAARAQLEAHRIAAEAEAEGIRIRAAAERDALQERLQSAPAYESNPALLKLQELETLADLGKDANARIYLGVDQTLDVYGSMRQVRATGS
jgi:hypothetical protein